MQKPALLWFLSFVFFGTLCFEILVWLLPCQPTRSDILHIMWGDRVIFGRDQWRRLGWESSERHSIPRLQRCAWRPKLEAGRRIPCVRTLSGCQALFPLDPIFQGKTQVSVRRL